MKRSFGRTHLRNVVFVLMAVLSASTAFAQTGVSAGYVIFSGTNYLDGTSEGSDAFSPSSCLWTGTSGGPFTNGSVYICINSAGPNGTLQFLTTSNSDCNIDLGTENGTSVGKTVSKSGSGGNKYPLVYNSSSSSWTTTKKLTDGGKVAFTVTKYTNPEVLTNPEITGAITFTGNEIGVTKNYTITTAPSYTSGYINYVFYNNTDHYFKADNTTPLTATPSAEGYLHSWELSDNAQGHVSVDNTTGAVTYYNPFDEDTEVILTLNAMSTTSNHVFTPARLTITFEAPKTDPESVSATDMTVYVGQSRNAEVTLTPNPCYRNLTFSSSDDDIATVNNDGVVTGVSVGTATVTVLAKKFTVNEYINTTFTVTVKDKVKTPVITFEPDEEGATATATITCETEGATIYYTTDGSTPTSESTQYNTATFQVNDGQTVKAIAIKEGDGWDNSDEVENTYYQRVLPTPTIHINNGSVTFTCAEPGVTFRYTTGENPVDPTPSTTTTWAEGMDPITTGITNEHIIKVIATKNGWSKSLVASRQYIMASGVSGNVVTLNDLEDHNWTLYQGVETTDDANYKTNYEGKFYFPDPRDVKIIYNANGGAVSKDESANQFVYYKTLAKENNAYKYTTIPNPFSKRPKNGDNYQGFSKWKITSITGGTITDQAVNSVVDAETELTFDPSSEYGMEVEFTAVWTTAYVVECAASAVSTNLNNTNLQGDSYETNFIVINGGSSSTNLNASSSKKVTITMVTPDGAIDYRNGSTYINPSTITLSNDWKFEYININNNNTTITANNHNLVLGRGISNTTSTSNVANIVQGMTNTNFPNNLNYHLRVESGVYNYMTYVNGYNANYGDLYGDLVSFSGSNNSIRGTLGCDYDRADNENNTRLKIKKELVLGYYSGFSNSNNKNLTTFKVTAKSGDFHSDIDNEIADADESFYFSLGGQQTNVGRRELYIEGGKFLSIAGGIDENNNAADETFYLRISGGHVRGSIYGCGAFAATKGHRRFIFTDGQIDGWIAAGCNGTDGSKSGGTLPSDTYVYIGGTTTVGYKNGTTPPHINTSDGGNVFGAGSGNAAQATTGQVNNSNVVIADESYVQNNVFGGGNYGYSNATAKVYVTGGTVAGKVFGGSNQKQGHTVNMCMTGGLVKGGIYGGSNVTGTISNNVTMQIDGGQVGTSTENANVHGGGYGQDTRVTGNVDVTLGTITNGKTAGTAVIYGDVYGGSALGNVNGTARDDSKHTNVTLNAGTINGNLYGGALGDNYRSANVYAPVLVTVNGGEVKNVFGCNNVNGKPQSTVNVLMTGGMVHECVYGGGNAADYTGNPVVTVRGGEVRQNVYGGGLGSEAIITGSTHVTIQGTAHVYGNVYGGGNGGKVTGNTHVDIGGVISE